MSIVKTNAAKAALEHVERGMKLGLGTGSTAAIFVDLLAEKVKAGLEVICVPTSVATQNQARELGIPLATLDELGELDLTIDGADEFDQDRNLIKGGGGALLREKIVASASKKMLVIADESKRVSPLGKFPLPIEVIPFGLASTTRHVATCLNTELNANIPLTLRLNQNNAPFITDEGNYILDAQCTKIINAKALHDALNCLTGVVENGLFINIAQQIIIGNEEGVVEI